MCFGFKCLSPRSSVQRIMAFIFLPNKVLCHTLKHIFWSIFRNIHSNNRLIFLSSLRQLVLLVLLFVFLLVYFSLLPVTWHTEAGIKCVDSPHCTFDNREDKKRMSKCPGPGWIGMADFYFHFWSSALLSNSQITPVFHPFQFLPLKEKFTGSYILKVYKETIILTFPPFKEACDLTVNLFEEKFYLKKLYWKAFDQILAEILVS